MCFGHQSLTLYGLTPLTEGYGGVPTSSCKINIDPVGKTNHCLLFGYSSLLWDILGGNFKNTEKRTGFTKRLARLLP